jgi:HlyD family secretion protein
MLKRLWRAFVTLVIVALVIGGVGLILLGRTTQAVPDQESLIIDETDVVEGDLSVTITGTGALAPARQVALFFELSGTVTEVLAQAGERVNTGDVIARIDTEALQDTVAQARAALDLQQIAYDALTAPARAVDIGVAQAALDSAEAAVNAAYTTNTETQAELARLQAEIARNRLWQTQLQRDLSVDASGASAGLNIDVGALIPDDVDVPQETIDEINAALSGLVTFPSFSSASPSDFDAGLTQAEYGVQIADANAAAAANRPGDIAGVASAQAAVIAAQVALDQLINGADDLTLQLAQIGIDQARLAVEQAESTIARGELTAPFDGVIAQNTLTVGELPPTQQPAVLLVDDSAYYVDLAIDETDIVDIAVGQRVELRFDALRDATVTGSVTRVAVTPTVIGQLVTFVVRVRLDETDENIRIGMSATATIIVNELENALIAPNRFIRIDRNSGQAFVTIERSTGVFEEIPVELGLRNETESQILSGAAVGERLVLLPRAQFDVFGGPPN